MAKSNYSTGNSKVKKAVAYISAFAIIAGAGSYALHTAGLLDAIHGTKISGPEQPGNIDAEKERTYLAEPFDINDKDAVEQRANTVLKTYKNATMYLDKNIKTQDKVELRDIKNIIYILNAKYEEITFKKGMDDAKKYEYLEWLKKFMAELLATNTVEEVNVLSGDKEFSIDDMNTSNYVWGTDFYATADTNKDLYEEMAELVITQVELKKNGEDRSKLVENAEKFYELNKKVVDNKELSEEVRLGLLQEAAGKAGHFTPYLSKEKVKFIDKNNQRIVDNRTFDTIYDYLGLDPDELDCVTKENTTIPFGKSYNSNDAKRANAGQTTKKESKVVDEGGKKIKTVTKTSKAKKKKTTTEVVIKTTIPKTNPENGKKVKTTETTKIETSKGGEPVGTTKVVVIEDPIATTTTTKKHETTKKTTTTTTTLKYEEPEMVWDDEIDAKVSYSNVPTATIKATSLKDDSTTLSIAIIAGMSLSGLGVAVVSKNYEDADKAKEKSSVKTLK